MDHIIIALFAYVFGIRKSKYEPGRLEKCNEDDRIAGRCGSDGLCISCVESKKYL
jgi:hypothetical protein